VTAKGIGYRSIDTKTVALCDYVTKTGTRGSHRTGHHLWGGEGASDRFTFFKLLIPRSNKALYTYVMFIKVRDNYKRVLALVAIGLGLLVWTVFGILFCLLQIFYFRFLKFLGKCYGNIRYG